MFFLKVSGLNCPYSSSTSVYFFET